MLEHCDARKSKKSRPHPVSGQDLLGQALLVLSELKRIARVALPRVGEHAKSRQIITSDLEARCRLFRERRLPRA